MSKIVDVLEAKTHLSRFVQRLRDGKEREEITALSDPARLGSWLTMLHTKA